MARDHLSFSAYKAYKDCAAKAMALDTNRMIRYSNEAMLVGSYVDARLTGGWDEFIKEHAQSIYKWPTLAEIKKEYPYLSKKKLGEIKEENPEVLLKFAIKSSAFEYAERIIEKVRYSQVIYDLMQGEFQVEKRIIIDGIDYIIKPDVIGTNFISDLKVVKSIKEWNWSQELGMRIPFYIERNYCLQLALYREGFPSKEEFQNVVLTKENPIDHSIVKYSHEMMDIEMAKLKQDHKQFLDIANGKFEDAPRCEKCDWCISSKETNIIEAEEWQT